MARVPSNPLSYCDHGSTPFMKGKLMTNDLILHIMWWLKWGWSGGCCLRCGLNSLVPWCKRCINRMAR